MSDCLIVNYDFVDENQGELIIRYNYRPSFIHDSQEEAEKELIRLGTKTKENQFVIFKAVAEAEYRDGHVFIKEIEED